MAQFVTGAFSPGRRWIQDPRDQLALQQQQLALRAQGQQQQHQLAQQQLAQQQQMTPFQSAGLAQRFLQDMLGRRDSQQQQQQAMARWAQEQRQQQQQQAFQNDLANRQLASNDFYKRGMVDAQNARATASAAPKPLTPAAQAQERKNQVERFMDTGSGPAAPLAGFLSPMGMGAAGQAGFASMAGAAPRRWWEKRAQEQGARALDMAKTNDELENLPYDQAVKRATREGQADMAGLSANSMRYQKWRRDMTPQVLAELESAGIAPTDDTGNPVPQGWIQNMLVDNVEQADDAYKRDLAIKQLEQKIADAEQVDPKTAQRLASLRIRATNDPNLFALNQFLRGDEVTNGLALVEQINGVLNDLNGSNLPASPEQAGTFFDYLLSAPNMDQGSVQTVRSIQQQYNEAYTGGSGGSATGGGAGGDMGGGGGGPGGSGGPAGALPLDRQDAMASPPASAFARRPDEPLVVEQARQRLRRQLYQADPRTLPADLRRLRESFLNGQIAPQQQQRIDQNQARIDANTAAQTFQNKAGQNLNLEQAQAWKRAMAALGNATSQADLASNVRRRTTNRLAPVGAVPENDNVLDEAIGKTTHGAVVSTPEDRHPWNKLPEYDYPAWMDAIAGLTAPGRFLTQGSAWDRPGRAARGALTGNNREATRENRMFAEQMGASMLAGPLGALAAQFPQSSPSWWLDKLTGKGAQPTGEGTSPADVARAALGSKWEAMGPGSQMAIEALVGAGTDPANLLFGAMGAPRAVAGAKRFARAPRQAIYDAQLAGRREWMRSPTKRALDAAPDAARRAVERARAAGAQGLERGGQLARQAGEQALERTVGAVERGANAVRRAGGTVQPPRLSPRRTPGYADPNKPIPRYPQRNAFGERAPYAPVGRGDRIVGEQARRAKAQQLVRERRTNQELARLQRQADAMTRESAAPWANPIERAPVTPEMRAANQAAARAAPGVRFGKQARPLRGRAAERASREGRYAGERAAQQGLAGFARPGKGPLPPTAPPGGPKPPRPPQPPAGGSGMYQRSLEGLKPGARRNVRPGQTPMSPAQQAERAAKKPQVRLPGDQPPATPATGSAEAPMWKRALTKATEPARVTRTETLGEAISKGPARQTQKAATDEIGRLTEQMVQETGRGPKNLKELYDYHGREVPDLSIPKPKTAPGRRARVQAGQQELFAGTPGAAPKPAAAPAPKPKPGQQELFGGTPRRPRTPEQQAFERGLKSAAPAKPKKPARTVEIKPGEPPAGTPARSARAKSELGAKAGAELERKKGQSLEAYHQELVDRYKGAPRREKQRIKILIDAAQAEMEATKRAARVARTGAERRAAADADVAKMTSAELTKAAKAAQAAQAPKRKAKRVTKRRTAEEKAQEKAAPKLSQEDKAANLFDFSGMGKGMAESYKRYVSTKPGGQELIDQGLWQEFQRLNEHLIKTRGTGTSPRSFLDNLDYSRNLYQKATGKPLGGEPAPEAPKPKKKTARRTTKQVEDAAQRRARRMDVQEAAKAEAGLADKATASRRLVEEGRFGGVKITDDRFKDFKKKVDVFYGWLDSLSGRKASKKTINAERERLGLKPWDDAFYKKWKQ